LILWFCSTLVLICLRLFVPGIFIAPVERCTVSLLSSVRTLHSSRRLNCVVWSSFIKRALFNTWKELEGIDISFSYCCYCVIICLAYVHAG
jgi:hypothetical protein